MVHLLKTIWGMLLDVLQFWRLRLIRWLTYKSPTQTWFRLLLDAKEYEEWERAALQLDVLFGNDLWRQNPSSKYYDYRLIHERLQSIILAREQGNFLQLVNLLRSGLVRNLGNISTPRLFNHAFAGTKLLIEDYVTQVAMAIADVTKLPTTQDIDEKRTHTSSRLSSQDKLNLFHDTRQAFGRTALVLQGGAIFGLCHLGVVKALFARGLLPRILAGTGTGALIAALVGTHTEDELPKLLNGESIDLRVIGGGNVTAPSCASKEGIPEGWWSRLTRKTMIFIRAKYFLDVCALEDCIKAKIGDLTFEEAYNRTKRVLNITVATTGKGGVPNLLNHLTAPNVLIWSAAVASNAPSPPLYGSSPILKCKDSSGAILPWSMASETTFRPWTHVSYSDRESPLTRITELFNVNHFIVSQARPHLIPFLQIDMRGPSLRNQRGRQTSLIGGLLRLIGMELNHRTHQLETLGLLPLSIRRFLVNEEIPGTAAITLAPKISLGDFARLLEQPSEANLKYWILRGEKSVWSAASALKVRCAIEIELDRGYQVVRCRKAAGIRIRNSAVDHQIGNIRSRERVRADSLNGKW
ncbi:hypothetical protein K3495_g10620 [Podosphaera aphanis]|nr:hypothetical protein K3495_g10620 [Podosphaera aphanis]